MKKSLLAGLFFGAVLLGANVCRAGDGSTSGVGENFHAAGTNISAAAVKIANEVEVGAVNAAMQVKTGAVWVAGQVKTGTVNAATSVQDTTGIPLTKDHRTAPELIESAKADAAAHKYRDALDTLDRLRHFKLTNEQQKEVDGLRAQITKAFQAGVPSAPNSVGSSK